MGTARISTATTVMHVFVKPVLSGMIILASLACVCFLIQGGYQYITSNGKPNKLEHAKKIIRNALVGLVIVCSAAALSALLAHAYASPTGGMSSKIPILTSIKPQPASSGLADVLIKAVTGFLQNIIDTIATPFMSALHYFTSGTPLMAVNSSVFELWLTIVAISDGLFVLLIALLGFHVMSYATFGLEEIEFKHLLPQIGGIFLLLNTSIFAIDGIISVSNVMIKALNAVFPTTSVWSTLGTVASQTGGISIAALLIMIVFLILAVILLVYYVGRLVTLYAGAVLSPLVLLLWLVPGFRDFVQNAAKLYLSTIFVLFIHVVILQLAASIFAGLIASSSTHSLDQIMAMVVGLSTVVALLKTQGVMMQLSYASIGPKSARMLGGQFINSVTNVTGGLRSGNKMDYRVGGAHSANVIKSSTPGSLAARKYVPSSNKITASMLRVRDPIPKNGGTEA